MSVCQFVLYALPNHCNHPIAMKLWWIIVLSEVVKREVL